MLDFPFMLWVKLPVVDRIRPQSNTFVMSVENKATGDLRLNDGPDAPQKGCWYLLGVLLKISDEHPGSAF